MIFFTSILSILSVQKVLKMMCLKSLEIEKLMCSKSLKIDVFEKSGNHYVSRVGGVEVGVGGICKSLLLLQAANFIVMMDSFLFILTGLWGSCSCWIRIDTFFLMKTNEIKNFFLFAAGLKPNKLRKMFSSWQFITCSQHPYPMAQSEV